MIIDAFYNNEVIYAIGMTIIHSIWQITVLSLLLYVTLKVLKDSPAPTRYALSILSMIIAFVSGLVTFIYHFYHSPTLIQLPTDQISGITDRIIYFPEYKLSTSGRLDLNEFVYEKLNPIFPVVSLVYFLGAFILAIKLTAGILIINKLKKGKRTSIPESLYLSFQSWIEMMKIKSNPVIIESVFAKVPMVIGYLRPIIVLPVSTFTQIPYNQVEAIILHELAHIKRKDYLINIIQSVIEIIFFYHPLIYWFSLQVAEERENCCDDIALQYFRDKVQYAKALANMEESRGRQLYPNLAFVKKKKNLLERIKRILYTKNMKTKISDRILAGTIIVAGAMIFLLTGSATFNDIKIDSGFNTPGHPELKINLSPLLKERDTVININKGTIITHQTDKKGTKKEYKMKMEKGELKELYINGEKIPENEFPQKKELVESTLKEIEKVKHEMANLNLEEAKVEIEKARHQIEEIDKEEIQKQIQKARNTIDSLDYENITVEIKKLLKDIDHEKIQVEINKAIRNLNEVDIKKELEHAKKELESIDVDSIRAIIKLSTDQNVEDEINKAMEKTKIIIESIKIDSIMEKVKKSMDDIEIKIKFHQDIDSIPDVSSHIYNHELLEKLSAQAKEITMQFDEIPEQVKEFSKQFKEYQNK